MLKLATTPIQQHGTLGRSRSAGTAGLSTPHTTTGAGPMRREAESCRAIDTAASSAASDLKRIASTAGFARRAAGCGAIDSESRGEGITSPDTGPHKRNNPLPVASRARAKRSASACAKSSVRWNQAGATVTSPHNVRESSPRFSVTLVSASAVCHVSAGQVSQRNFEPPYAVGAPRVRRRFSFANPPSAGALPAGGFSCAPGASHEHR